jgi:POT family proton-dependent oligopeptide transporter
MMSLNPLFVIALTPLFATLWPWLSQRGREPSSPMKFAIGLAFVAAGTSLMVPASLLAMQGKVSPLWLAAVFFLQTVGELCLSPVGLSTVNQLAPSRFASMAMGFWYLSICLGSVIAGKLAGLLSSENPHGIAVLFGIMAVCALAAAFGMRWLTPTVKRMMRGQS